MSGEIKVEMKTNTQVLNANVTVTHKLGPWEGLMLTALVVAVLIALSSCTGPQIHIQDPVSMEMWTDHPDDPDPLEACQFPWWAEAVVGVNGPGATGIITASGQGTRGRIDFHRDGVPLGNPNHASVLVWFQAGLVDATTREHHRLPWTGTLWLPGYAVWLPDWARRLV